MFWTKCNKLLIDGSQVIDCGNCPCGYYGLFAIIARSWDKKTDSVNYCYTSVDVQAMEVLNNVLRYNSRCIPVNRKPDAEGKVGYQKSCIDCYDECVEWDENYENCQKYEEYCMDCSEITVYRISPCFDDYNEFAAWFYGGCGVSPDDNGKYPNIFEESYGQKYMSGNASNCVANHWQAIADAKYKPNIKLTFDVYSWGFNFYPYNQKCATREVCYTECEGGECTEWGDNGCSHCEGGTLKTTCHDECDHPLYEAIYVDRNDAYYSIGGSAWWKDDCGYGNGCWMYDYPNCCEYWSGSRDALGKMNQYDSEGIANLAGYDLESTEAINFPRDWGNMCWSKDYEAYHGCYTYSGPCWHFWHSVRYGKMKIEKGDASPAGATGIECYVTAYTYKTNDEDSITKDEYNYIWEKEKVTFTFGEEKEFPVVNNCKQYYIYNDTTCDEDCNNGNQPEYAPGGWHNQTEYFKIDLAPIRYVY